MNRMLKYIIIVAIALFLSAASFWLGGYLQSSKADDRSLALLAEDYCQKVEVEHSQFPSRSDQIREKIDDIRNGKKECDGVAYGGIRDRLYLISSHLYGIEMLSRSLQTVTKKKKQSIPPFRMVSSDIDSALVSILEQKCRYKSKDIEKWDVLVGKSLLQASKSLNEAKQSCLDHGYVPLKERQSASIQKSK